MPPRQLSPDGRYYWDGIHHVWKPVEQPKPLGCASRGCATIIILAICLAAFVFGFKLFALVLNT